MNYSEKSEKFDEHQDEMWENFFPLLLETAKEINFSFKVQQQEPVIKIRFENEKSGNIFFVISGYDDGIGAKYFRFTGYVSYITDSMNFREILKTSKSLGVSLYIDDVVFDSDLALKYDQPTIGGFPSNVWFRYILRMFDAYLTTYKKMYSTDL